MPLLSDPTVSIRAAHLTSLDGLGITLPAEVAGAIRAVQAAAQMPMPPPPGEVTTRAIVDTALSVARAAGADPAVLTRPLDTGPIGGARAAEQEARDQAMLAVEVVAAAAHVLLAVVSEHQADIISAIQGKHAEVIGKLVKCAQRLPPGTDDQVALAEGGQVRVDYLAACDLVATATALRDALALVEDAWPTETPDGLAVTTAYEKTGALYVGWSPRSWDTSYGDPGSLGFWLSAGREPAYEWWLPTAAQLSQRLAELRNDMQTRAAQRLPAGAVY